MEMFAWGMILGNFFPIILVILVVLLVVAGLVVAKTGTVILTFRGWRGEAVLLGGAVRRAFFWTLMFVMVALIALP
ncbi:MAG: hypothetical protein KBD50_01725 [Candidatus Pacebacteria bacterium]|nr:hypothetical protein [Candidatus Paceibacterota bacterium]